MIHIVIIDNYAGDRVMCNKKVSPALELLVGLFQVQRSTSYHEHIEH